MVATQNPPRIRLVLVLFCLALWLPGFFSLPPGDRDESRFAQASKQMNETGDYVHIMNGTEPRLRKPIGIYWLQAASAWVAGPNLANLNLANPIWPYRIPSLLGGLLAVLATYQAGLLLTPSRRAAALAAGMLAACVLLTTETHIAKTDAALLGVTTLAAAILARVWLGAARPSDPAAPVMPGWQAAVFWCAMAAGILLKGPVTPMVLGLTAAVLCVWERRVRWLAGLRSAWGVPLMLVLVLPWFVAIGVSTHGAFFADAVGRDLGSKLAGGSDSHGAPPGLHLLLLPLLAFPSTLPVLAGLPAAWASRRDPATRFLMAWVVPSWLVFEAVPTKLPHYTLPLYPALFLLAARGLEQLPRRWVSMTGRIALALAAGVLAVASVALPLLLHESWWLGFPGLVAVAVTAWLAWHRRLALALCSAVPLYACLLQVELPNLSALWIGPRVSAVLRHDWPGYNPQGAGLAVAGYAEPSLVFLAGTQTQLLPNGALAAGALQSGKTTAVLVSDREMGRFEAAARALGIAPRLGGAVAGYNYSRGRWVTLSLMLK
jgi:4-amino-4-deoxy-L-arabinose transferase-like glycosyltransferase